MFAGFGDAPVGAICAFAGEVAPLASSPSSRLTTAGVAREEAAEATADSPVVLIEAMGWMVCDGRELLVAACPDLFASIGYRYGGSVGSFRIPDCRGLFLRGVDAGAGVDPQSGERMAASGSGTDGGPGSLQMDALHEHQHALTPGQIPAGDAAPLMVALPESAAAGQAGTDNPITPQDRVSADETRPRNIAFHFIIKYRRS